MATDVIESEVVLKSAGERSLNNNTSELLDMDCKTYESLESNVGEIQSPSSFGVSGEEYEAVDDLQDSKSTSTLENGEEAAPWSPTQTGGPLQETATLDNGQKQEAQRSSTPVTVPQQSPASAHNGRSDVLTVFVCFSNYEDTDSTLHMDICLSHLIPIPLL